MKFYLVLLLILPQLTFAQEGSQTLHQVGVVLDSWSFEESRNKDSGTLFGIYYRLETTLNSFFNFSFVGEYLQGGTDYESFDLATGMNSVTIDNTNTIYSLMATIQLKTSRYFTPFLGVSYRYLNDEDDDFNGDFEREQTYITVPIGVMVNFNKSRLTLLYHSSFSGEHTRHLDDVSGSPAEVDFDQDSGSGLLIEYEHFFASLSLTAFYRTWDVDSSEVKTVNLPMVGTRDTLEPENETQSMGLRLSYLF